MSSNQRAVNVSLQLVILFSVFLMGVSAAMIVRSETVVTHASNQASRWDEPTVEFKITKNHPTILIPNTLQRNKSEKPVMI